MQRALKYAIACSMLVPALMTVSCETAGAQVDSAQVEKRKTVIHTCLLSIYVQQRKRPQALAEYGILVGMSPNDPKLRAQYGQYLAAGGTPADFAAAVVQLEKAVQLDPSNCQNQGILGTVYLKMKKPEKALPFLKNAVSYGCKDYDKAYKDTWAYLQQMKAINEQKKKQELQKKQQQQQNPAGGKPGAPKKGGDDDDDDDW